VAWLFGIARNKLLHARQRNGQPRSNAAANVSAARSAANSESPHGPPGDADRGKSQHTRERCRAAALTLRALRRRAIADLRDQQAARRSRAPPV
jgi:DNA-directed RNA polymerase specialized sigma24 family protein